jgi:hypothetical protein
VSTDHLLVTFMMCNVCMCVCVYVYVYVYVYVCMCMCVCVRAVITREGLRLLLPPTGRRGARAATEQRAHTHTLTHATIAKRIRAHSDEYIRLWHCEQ